MSKGERPVPFNVPYVTGRELQYLEEVIRGRKFAGNGPFTRRVQELLERRYGVAKVLLTHSCTGALELSALLLGVGPEDEVILPSYTFCSTASAFMRTGARLIFCEVDPASLMMDPVDVRRRVTRRTRVIVPVHYAGLSCQIDELLTIAHECGATVVEDAAQGVESRLGGRPLGTFGRLGCYSFHETKNLHCGLGGALLINDGDPTLVERAVQVWERGTNRAAQLKGAVDKYTWTALGSSFYPSELQAAFLLAQLENIDANLDERRPIYMAYVDELSQLAADGRIGIPPFLPNEQINYHAFYVIFPSAEKCDRVRLSLQRAGISAYIGYVPLHSSPMGQSLGWKPDDLPVTEDVALRVLRLPLHGEMTAADARRIATQLSGVL